MINRLIAAENVLIVTSCSQPLCSLKKVMELGIVTGNFEQCVLVSNNVGTNEQMDNLFENDVQIRSENISAYLLLRSILVLKDFLVSLGLDYNYQNNLLREYVFHESKDVRCLDDRR